MQSLFPKLQLLKNGYVVTNNTNALINHEILNRKHFSWTSTAQDIVNLRNKNLKYAFNVSTQ